VNIEQSLRDDCVVLALHGRLDSSRAPRVLRSLRQSQRQRPAAVVVDLTGVSALDTGAAMVLVAAARPVTGRPGRAVLLCGARPAVATALREVGGSHLAPLFATVEDALAEVSTRPPYPRRELRLAPTPRAAFQARVFVVGVCREWELDRVSEAARLVASELVTNGVLHARGAVALRLELRDRALYLAVHDTSRDPPRPMKPAEEAESGRGLVVVQQLAWSWGVRPDPDGGKVVWSMLAW